MTFEQKIKPPYASREEIELLYRQLLGRHPSEEEVSGRYKAEAELETLLKDFLRSPEFSMVHAGINERLEALARTLCSLLERDWLVAKVHVTTLYLRYCDWTRFATEASSDVLAEPVVDAVTQQETRLLVWMVQANELYSQLKEVDATYKSHLDEMGWRFHSLESQIATLGEKMDRVIQHSPEGDRALLTEILLRLDRISDLPDRLAEE